MPHSIHTRSSSRKPSPSSLSGVSPLAYIPETPEMQKVAFLERERAHTNAVSRREAKVLKYVDPNANFFVRKWLWFESTFALSMLEPWEKVLVLAFLFFLFSLITIGICRYLPFHLQFLNRRARYYFLGDEAAVLSEAANLMTESWL